ncbi:MAG: hypothetical protein IPP19_13470 [Verrucomicrobia bacterium]|nr:hypothetical protein [Verrucomicrobiota bacterium]
MPKNITKTKKYTLLTSCLNELLELGIVYNAGSGYTESDAISDLSDIYQAMKPKAKKGIWGYCLYHEQDSERVLKGKSLMLSFGALNDEKKTIIKVGKTITEVLSKNGFKVKWDGTETERIELISYTK